MNNSYKFFQNIECEYYPCHKIDNTENFNCLFCFCPLHNLKDCPGNPVYLPNGFKDCSNCLLPHVNYDKVIERLKGEISNV